MKNEKAQATSEPVINQVYVESMNSPRTGAPVANQFIINTNDGLYFQSYRTVIAFKALNGDVYLDENAWDYSRTTIKYRNVFLNETTADTKAKIKSGEYKLIELNK